MTQLPLKVRFIHTMAYRLTVFESVECKHKHDIQGVTEWNEEMQKDHPCDLCGNAFHSDHSYPLYNTESGRPEHGDLFYEDWLEQNTYWDNQEGPHLMVICPNGTRWCIDSRASNCTMPDDRLHRCWVRHGDPSKGEIHVDKNGHTCQAGGGSIHVDQGTPNEYHGMLQNSQFT